MHTAYIPDPVQITDLVATFLITSKRERNHWAGGLARL